MTGDLYNLGVISRCGIHEIVSLSWRKVAREWMCADEAGILGVDL